jgi:hypothetical protein
VEADRSLYAEGDGPVAAVSGSSAGGGEIIGISLRVKPTRDALEVLLAAERVVVRLRR